MSYDRAQLVTQALIELNVIAEGQSVSDSDMAKMDGYVNGAMSELNGLEIFYVADFGELGPTGGNFDDAAFLSLAKYLANAATAGFNQAADEKMKALEIEAIARLRTLSRPPRAKARLNIDPALRVHRSQFSRFPNNG